MPATGVWIRNVETNLAGIPRINTRAVLHRLALPYLTAGCSNWVRPHRIAGEHVRDIQVVSRLLEGPATGNSRALRRFAANQRVGQADKSNHGVRNVRNRCLLRARARNTGTHGRAFPAGVSRLCNRNPRHTLSGVGESALSPQRQELRRAG